MSARPVVGVSAALWEAGRLLLVRRARPPFAGLWSLPGGKIEPGEAARAACLRELAEETGLAAELLGLVDVADIVLREGAAVTAHVTLLVFAARRLSGEARAGGDAADLRWASPAELDALPLAPESRRMGEAARRFF
ncbi:MAG: NUDIX hydrolase [Alphaproteobacteria bacterium]|nr:NUDIX hydrolase [Alphaproteobacteria bacterium]